MLKTLLHLISFSSPQSFMSGSFFTKQQKTCYTQSINIGVIKHPNYYFFTIKLTKTSITPDASSKIFCNLATVKWYFQKILQQVVKLFLLYFISLSLSLSLSLSPLSLTRSLSLSQISMEMMLWWRRGDRGSWWSHSCGQDTMVLFLGHDGCDDGGFVEICS